LRGSSHALEEERRSAINRYAVAGKLGAAQEVSGEQYIAANRALDRDQERLIREKAETVAALRSPQQEDFVDASLRQFCAAAHARWQGCTDDEATRQFMVGHVDRVIYNRYQVAVAGFVPVQSASGETKLRFRIEGEINIAAVRSNSCRKARLARVQSGARLPAALALDRHPEPVV
jgi:hypothetical protein